MSEGVLALPYHTRWNSTKRGDETLPGQRALLHFLLVAPMSLQNPTNPTIAAVSGISKVFVVVGFKVADPTIFSITRRQTILLVG
jgi:hypothetical protein